MEKKIIPLKHRLKYMIGFRFDRMKHMRKGATVTDGWYLFLGFYWFCLTFYKDWPTAVLPSCGMYGIGFSYKPVARLEEGGLMWQKEKRLMRYRCPREAKDAA